MFPPQPLERNGRCRYVWLSHNSGQVHRVNWHVRRGGLLFQLPAHNGNRTRRVRLRNERGRNGLVRMIRQWTQVVNHFQECVCVVPRAHALTSIWIGARTFPKQTLHHVFMPWDELIARIQQRFSHWAIFPHSQHITRGHSMSSVSHWISQCFVHFVPPQSRERDAQMIG